MIMGWPCVCVCVYPYKGQTEDNGKEGFCHWKLGETDMPLNKARETKKAVRKGTQTDQSEAEDLKRGRQSEKTHGEMSHQLHRDTKMG